MKILALLFAVTLYGQQLEVVNGTIESRDFSGDLATHLSAAGTNWIGYAIASTSGTSGWQWCQANRTSVPQGTGKTIILARAVNGSVDEIRLQAEACPFDSNGRSVTWLTNVPVAASLKFLKDTATANASESTSSSAVSAIAIHDDPAAEMVLEAFADPSQPERLRQRASFWLGSKSTASGVQILTRMIDSDPSTRVREQAVFGLSVSRQPQAADVLMHTASSNPSAQVRGRAIFWLAQKNDPKARAIVRRAIDSDPDHGVRRQAVFALSRFTGKDAVADLVDVALHGPADVRHTAAFWLGQSKDEAALEFAREALSK